MSTLATTATAEPTHEPGEAGALARELATAYKGLAEYYKDQWQLSTPEAVANDVAHPHSICRGALDRTAMLSPTPPRALGSCAMSHTILTNSLTSRCLVDHFPVVFSHTFPDGAWGAGPNADTSQSV